MTTELKVGQEFKKVISERRSVRKYDPSWKISREEIEEILNDAILAPSSSNLQPWRFIVINDQSVQEKLLPIAFNQQQTVDASAIIAVLGDTEAYRNVHTIYDKAQAEGFITPEIKETMVNNTWNNYSSFSPERRSNIALVDGGLISMQLMLAAKAKGYDTVPMGGYDANAFRELFQIPERYVPVMLIALGKAAAEGRPTTRLPLEQVTFWNEFQGEK
ncbi:nitroreductase family protein [Paenibacillus sp. GCM10012306]|uniref:nitroreductase family protein n=1 Tax=Paenibacillus sp. GCM10012306 TaxID=3317342 RepID=UPI0036099307